MTRGGKLQVAIGLTSTTTSFDAITESRSDVTM